MHNDFYIVITITSDKFTNTCACVCVCICTRFCVCTWMNDDHLKKKIQKKCRVNGWVKLEGYTFVSHQIIANRCSHIFLFFNSMLVINLQLLSFFDLYFPLISKVKDSPINWCCKLHVFLFQNYFRWRLLELIKLRKKQENI